MIYQIDYLAKDYKKHQEENPKLPRYIVSPDFNSALILARTFENDNYAVFDLKIVHSDGHVAVTDNFEGI